MGYYRLILICCILLLSNSLRSQEFLYRIYFADKIGNLRSSGIDYLSDRALERRERHNIVLDSTDLPISSDYLAQLFSLDKIEYKTHSKWFNRVVVAVVDTSVNSKIRSFGFVKKMEKIPGSGVKSADYSDENKFSDTITFDHEIASSELLNFPQNDLINVDFLHERGYTGEGVRVAVIDAGFTGANQMASLQHMYAYRKVIDEYDFVDNDDYVYHRSVHGTFVWSVMAAIIEGEYMGIAPDAEYILLRSEDGASETIIEEDYWVAAAEFADSAGADILNTSLGYTRFEDSLQDHSYEDLDGETTIITLGAQMAASKGMLVVNSAGNLGAVDWRFVSPPADGQNVLTVGSVNLEGEVSGFSSRGPTADGRIKPNVVTPGQAVSIVNTQDEVVKASGTSFSSPILAAGAACLLQSLPEITSDELFDAIERSAHNYLDPNNDFGFGIPNFAAAYLILSSAESKIENSPVQIFPNPFNEKVNIYLNSSQNQLIEIRLIDVTGKVIFRYEQELNKGDNQLIELDAIGSSINQGVYFLEINANDDSLVKKLIKS